MALAAGCVEFMINSLRCTVICSVYFISNTQVTEIMGFSARKD